MLVKTILDPSLENLEKLEVLIGVNDEELKEILKQIFLELKCKIYIPPNIEDAQRKLYFYNFDIVVIEENYSIDIMKFLASLPMSRRRTMFYILIGDSFESGNLMQSYVLSANLVFNKEDLEYFSNILIDSIIENNHFYRSLYVIYHNLLERGYN